MIRTEQERSVVDSGEWKMMSFATPDFSRKNVNIHHRPRSPARGAWKYENR